MEQNFQFLQTLLQLGWPAIVLIQCIILWRDNIALRDKLIASLENKEITRQVQPTSIIHTGQD